MKKKGVNIIAILAIILVLVVVGIILAIVLSKQKAPDGADLPAYGQEDRSMLELESREAFLAYSEEGEYECVMATDMPFGSIFDVPLMEQRAVVTYQFDEQGKTTELRAFYYLNSEFSEDEVQEIWEITVGELSDATIGAVESFCGMFGCTEIPDIYLTNNDGTFTKIEEDTDFQAIADGSSELRFGIRDEEGYFWELTVRLNGELYVVAVDKYFNVEEMLPYVADISLYEEE